jgi:hypothetical protein
MATSRRGNGGEPVSSAAVATTSSSSSAAHASAAAADPPPHVLFGVTDAMRKEARDSARNAVRRKWPKWSEEDKVEATDGLLEVIVEREAAKAREEAERREKEAAKAREEAERREKEAAKAELDKAIGIRK